MELLPADPSSSSDDVYGLAEPEEPGKPNLSAATMEAAPLVVGLGERPGGDGASETAPGVGASEAEENGSASSVPSPSNGAKGDSGPRAKAAAPKAPKLRPRRRGRIRLRYLLQAWSVSLVVHVGILTALAAATFSASDSIKQVLNIDSALAGHRAGEQEVLPIYADPDNIDRNKTIGDEHADDAREPALIVVGEGGGDSDGDDGGVIVAGGQGTGRPSATPRVRGAGKGKINENASLPGVKIDGLSRSPLNLLPVAPAADLGGGGKIAGDPIFDVKEIGVAMDQLAREIIRQLKDHKITVVWLFDESVSMEDDKKTIAEKFDRVSSELKKYIDQDKTKKSAGALNHAIVGFGQGLDYMLEKPRDDIDQIGRAIKKLRIDPTGIENTMGAIREVAEHYASLTRRGDRKVLMVLVTDESGDDGADVEEARQALKRNKIPLYVIGRQSLFGYPFAHHRYEDPVTRDVYHPLIRRGPETADLELYQWDGLYDRWDEQPSGFASYELARLTKESGGIYFVLPSEEFMRVRHREQAYSITQLKEYLPEYDNRLTYTEKRTASPLRQTLHAIVMQGRNFIYRRDFPVEHPALVQAALEEGQKAGIKLAALLEIQQRLEKLKMARDREPEKRWQAHYDLMLAQTVAFEVKAYEYRALMASIVKNPPSPKAQPRPDLMITWVVDHAREPLAPHSETAKKYAEAERLLKEVIAKHPKTPWADLAQDTLNRGFSVRLNEWHHNPKYYDRLQFVPKY
jgi:hypothetical protein